MLLLLLLLLLAAVLTKRTSASPVPRVTRLPPEAKECHIASFKSLSPQEVQAFKKAKDALVSLPPGWAGPTAAFLGFTPYATWDESGLHTFCRALALALPAVGWLPPLLQ